MMDSSENFWRKCKRGALNFFSNKQGVIYNLEGGSGNLTRIVSLED